MRRICVPQNDVEDEITEQKVMKGAFNACKDLKSHQLYVGLRRLLIENPVLTPLEIFHEKRNLHGLEEVLNDAYEVGPAAYYHEGKYMECGRCGSLLVKNKVGQLCCEDLICREEGPTRLRRKWEETVLQLKRGLRRFVARPGLVELRLFQKLQRDSGVEVELWPDFDRYDLKITIGGEVWAVDVKDWTNPFLLGRSINEKGQFPRSSEEPWTRAFWVFPNERDSPNGYYMAAFKNSCRQLDKQAEAVFEKGLLQRVSRRASR